MKFRPETGCELPGKTGPDPVSSTETGPDPVFRRGVVHHGNGAQMGEVADGEADVVFTGPPYWPADVEPLLARPLREQSDFAGVSHRVVAYALSLRPVFVEMRRVLARHGTLILQTKDLRYAGFLIGLAGVHRQLAESVGLALVTRVLWEPMFQQASQRARVPAAPRPGTRMRVRETEEFLVMADPRSVTAGQVSVTAGPGPAPRAESREPDFGGSRAAIELSPSEAADSLTPVWRLPGPGGSARHPHQSPAPVVRRLLAIYSRPGDLVVDPFAGGAGILQVAVKMRRSAIGYEIDEARARIAHEVLAEIEIPRGGFPAPGARA